MCSPAKCPNCSKTTWTGCGDHVEQVMSMVPDDQQCRCTAEERAAAPVKSGLFSRLFSR